MEYNLKGNYYQYTENNYSLMKKNYLIGVEQNNIFSSFNYLKYIFKNKIDYDYDFLKYCFLKNIKLLIYNYNLSVFDDYYISIIYNNKDIPNIDYFTCQIVDRELLHIIDAYISEICVNKNNILNINTDIFFKHQLYEYYLNLYYIEIYNNNISHGIKININNESINKIRIKMKKILKIKNMKILMKILIKI